MEKQRGKRAHIYTREKEQEEKFTSLYSKTTFYAIQFWLAKQHGACHTCFHKDLILEGRGGAGICFAKFVFICTNWFLLQPSARALTGLCCYLRRTFASQKNCVKSVL